MAIKSSLLGKILEELASLRTNTTISLANDRLKEDDDMGPFGWPGSVTGMVFPTKKCPHGEVKFRPLVT